MSNPRRARRRCVIWLKPRTLDDPVPFAKLLICLPLTPQPKVWRGTCISKKEVGKRIWLKLRDPSFTKSGKP